MCNKFVQAATDATNATTTENGHAAVCSTGSAVLDLYSQVGALRNQDFNSRVKPLLDKAIRDDKLLATKTVFYARDTKEGTGERKLFRNMIHWMAINYPETIKNNIYNIPSYGRWDDLYSLINTPLENNMWEIINNQFHLDWKQLKAGNNISLLAKWLKSCNASSKESRKLGRLTAEHLKLSEANYRRMLSKLRKAIDIVESKISSNRWGEINYDKLPSKAGMIYRKAFKKHDNERYKEYIDAVNSGSKKINTAMNTPQDLVHAYTNGYIYYNPNFDEDPTIEAMWKNLPDFVQSDENIICMVDVSGSMTGRPVEISVGLGMYFAQHNKGAFHNLFMTFESHPSFIKLDDNASFAENLVTTIRAPWGGSTNLNKACREMLSFALKNNVPNEDMPTRLIIISDMEIDRATMCYSDNNILHIDELKKMYNDAGYNMPQVIYWNVDSRDNHFQTKSNVKGTMLASGSSPALFKSVLAMENMVVTPLDAMLEVLNGERYNSINIATD